MEQKHSIFDHTREIIAMFSVVASFVLIGYVIFWFGYKTEILTLLIGVITGVIGTTFGFYFQATFGKKPEMLLPAPGTTNASITADITTTPTPTPIQTSTTADTKDVKVEGFNSRK